MPVTVVRATRNTRKKRTAAYVRVSTWEEMQDGSFRVQQDYYARKIRSNPEWDFAGIYAERETGTHLDNRQQFNQMVDDALDGKVDIILCKSISRWGRNIVDALRSIKLLDSNHVRIIFEQENIDTLYPGAVLQMNLAAAIAQSESESNSLNHKWTYRQNAKRGVHAIGSNHYLCYDGEGDTLIPNDKAEYVRKIYEDFVAGKHYDEIADELNSLGVRTVANKPFTRSSVRNILINEAYKGDLRFQKTPSRNIITGEVDDIQVDVYITDHHEAVVSRELWDKAQERVELFRNGDPKARRGIHFLTHRIVCGECGSIFRRRTNPDGRGGTVSVWKCKNREINGKCMCRYVKESELFDSLQLQLDIPEVTAQSTEKVKRITVYEDRVVVE